MSQEVEDGGPGAIASVTGEGHGRGGEALARLRARQNAYLRRMMQLCAEAHPHYKELLQQRGLAPRDFRSVEDLRALPVLRKEEYTRDPERFRLNLDDVSGVAPEEAALADIIYTTGSTGRPAPFYDTVHDRFARVHHMQKVATIAGIVPQDKVANLFPLTSVPHQGFLSAMWGTMGVGATLVSTLTGRPYPEFPVHNRMDQAIEMIEAQRATVLWGIASYVRRLLVRAQEMGRDFSAVRLAMVMGEACPLGMREDIRSRLEDLGSLDPTINNGYGFTEMQGPAVECVERGGKHQAVPEQFYFEVVDVETGDPMPDGKEGALLVTHLNRRGTVMLRYMTGDVVAVTNEACPDCGRTEPRFLGTPYRTDGLIKVKGTLVKPSAIHETLSSYLGRGIAEYQIVATRENPDDPFSPDTILVRAACHRDVRETMAPQIRTAVSRHVEITPEVELLPEDAFSDMDGRYKFTRFVDERQTPSPVSSPGRTSRTAPGSVGE